MCGYVGRKHQVAEDDIHYWREFANLLRLPPAQYYQRRMVDQLVIMENQTPVATPAMWWYMLKREGDKMVVNPKVTSFNARNLDAPMWRSAIRQRRAILFASEIGESLGNKRFLMEAETIFPLACIYNDWQLNGETMRSFALITRDPHPRFSRYHDKSMPLFLPSDPQFLMEWLNPNIETSPQIDAVISQSRLRVNFKVTEVKTYKRAEALSASEILEADPPEEYDVY